MQCEKMTLQMCTSEDIDQLKHLWSLIQVFTRGCWDSQGSSGQAVKTVDLTFVFIRHMSKGNFFLVVGLWLIHENDM